MEPLEASDFIVTYEQQRPIDTPKKYRDVRRRWTGIGRVLLTAAGEPVEVYDPPTETEIQEQLAGTATLQGVYFVRAADTGLVKIGSSKDIRTRIRKLETGSAGTLTIETFIPVYANLLTAEKWFHQYFSRQRLRREWFDIPEPIIGMLIRVAPYKSQLSSWGYRSRPSEALSAWTEVFERLW